MKHLQNLSVKLWFVLLLVLVFGRVALLGQNVVDNQHQITDILKKTNRVYGPDEMLENGRLYIPAHPKAKGYPYFLGTGWPAGNLIIKGDSFTNLKIKYNVNLEQLILRKEIENQESHIPILLNNNFIDSFDAEDHHFINLNAMPFNDELSGFAELIYQGQLIFLVKHTKEFIPRYSQSNPYGAYSKLLSIYYIYENDELTRLSTKRTFLNYFEPFRREVKKYMRQNSIIYKKATNTQLYELIKYCDEISHD